MTKVASIDRLVDLVGPFIDAIVECAAVRVAAAASPPDVAWYDQNTSPLTKRAYLDAARRGAFAARKVGRRVFAKRADVDEYIASRPAHACAVVSKENDSDDRTLLVKAGVRLRRTR